MTRSRRYLNNLPNAEIIKELARNILDYELKLDLAIQDSARVKNEILTLETQILFFDKEEDPQKIKNIKMKLDNLASVLLLDDKKIAELKKEISSSKSKVDEEIREGLSKLFQQAKSDWMKHNTTLSSINNR